MNYQICLESYAAGEGINKDKQSLLELELDSKIESIKLSQTRLHRKSTKTHLRGCSSKRRE